MNAKNVGQDASATQIKSVKSINAGANINLGVKNVGQSAGAVQVKGYKNIGAAVNFNN